MYTTHEIAAPRADSLTSRIRRVSMGQIGGLAALLLAAGYVATMPLFALVGAPPEGALARLEFHAEGAATWWAIVALSLLTDLLFVPVAAALHASLRQRGETAMLIATTFTILFVVLDLAVLWPAKVANIELGAAYASASAAERELLLAAAPYPAAVLDSILVPVYSVLTLSIGILVASIVMAGGPGRVTAAVGVLTGLVGIASVAERVVTGTFPVLVVVASLLTIMWLVAVGWGLLRSRWSPGERRIGDVPRDPAVAQSVTG